MIKQLKQIHHQLLVKRILSRRLSVFGNTIHQPLGVSAQKVDWDVKPTDSLAVIVIMHNNRTIIGRCIESLIKFNSYGYDIVVVDNQSTDGSYDFLKKKYGETIVLVKNMVNGCASGRNLGVQQTQASLLLFLDSDQGPISRDWLDEFLAIIVQFKEIGAIGWHGGFLTEKDLTGPSLGHLAGRGFSPKLAFRTNIDYLESGGLLVNRDVFDKVGGFDPTYDPFTFADVDFSRKIVRAGYQLAYSPALSIYHIAHSTTQADRPNEIYLRQFRKNASIFRRKWLK